MREITVQQIEEKVKSLFLAAGTDIGEDISACLKHSRDNEPSPVGKNVLEQIIKNNQIAADEKLPICQDTGMAVVFAEIGQDVHIAGGSFEDAVNRGVKSAYQDGYFRKSIVSEPLFNRKNTQDNTPAVIHVKLVDGSSIKLSAVAKGFGSENMSAIKMLVPADGVEGVKKFVLDTVRNAGPNPCPPIIVGIGIGGSFEKAAIMAKKCTAKPLDQNNPDERYARLEEELLKDINRLGIGPGGLGGKTTALKVHIEYAPTHIAGMPVAINICCHAARHKTATI
ncbi:MAG: fumarate hydratase [Eubacteriales bacterium]|nr:fumarate hydratase [Eubacteriales bacterium]